MAQLTPVCHIFQTIYIYSVQSHKYIPSKQTKMDL